METSSSPVSPLLSEALPENLSVLISEDRIRQRICELAAEINTRCRDAGITRLTVVAVLKGAFMFLSDLVRQLDVPCQIEFVRLSSYGNSTKSSGTVRPVDISLPNLAGLHVLVVDDIIDTGLTLSFLVDYLISLHRIKSLQLAVLLDKPTSRNPSASLLKVDFKAFTVGDEFVVGYGLDYAGLYRNLPYIGVLRDLPDATDTAADTP